MTKIYRKTGTREKVLKFINDSVAERGFPPTYVEIAEGCDLSGPGPVKYVLDQLEELGYIRRGRGARMITVLDKGPSVAV